jgi:hypothetical protein
MKAGWAGFGSGGQGRQVQPSCWLWHSSLQDVNAAREQKPHLEYGDGLAAHDVDCKLVGGHVRAAPGAIHREEAQPCDAHAVDVVVRVADQLVRLQVAERIQSKLMIG